jgi:hypothetical protein
MALGIVFILSACSASGADESARNGAGTPSVSEAPLDNDAPTSSGESPRADDAPSSDSPSSDSPSGDGEPESETPDATPNGDAQDDLQSSEQDRITICHRTNGSNEWVEITISESAVDAHLDHPWGSDIVPAPPEGCPGEATPTTTSPQPTTTPPPEPTTPPVLPPTTTPPEPTTPPVLPPTTTPPEPTTPPPDALLPETSDPSEGGPPPATQAPAATEPDPDDLPPTGGNQVLSLLALALVTVGAGAVRVSRR